MPISTLTTDPAERLPQYNLQDYDPSDNPYGLGDGGHVVTPEGSESFNLHQMGLDAAAVGGNTYDNASTTSLAIGTGSKVFTLSLVRSYIVGSYILAAYDASNTMFGQITAWNSGTKQLTVSVSKTTGSGTRASWTFSGPCGPQGETGASGAGSGDMLVATYDPAGVAQQVVGLTATQTLTNKTLTSSVLNTGVSGTAVLDEDDMASNSDTKIATQQSIKAYVDAKAAHPGFISGQYYPMTGSSGQITTGALTANRLYAVPFFVPKSATFDRIGISVTGAASGKSIRLGIYQNSDGAPGALTLDAGTVSVATTGRKEITISQALTPGWYFLALVSDGAPTVKIYTDETGQLGWFGPCDPDTLVSYNGRLYRSFTYAALPDPFGSISYGGTALGLVMRAA